MSCILQPQASSSQLQVADFHPLDSQFFLLAFQDGSIAAYKYKQAKLPAHQREAGHGQGISCMRRLHPTTSHIDSVVEAVFLPLRRLQAVSIARDGLCRLIDFSHGGELLRTWRPLGLPIRVAAVSSDVARSTTRSSTSGGPVCMIAVACDNHVVALYDCLGLLQHRITLTCPLGSIIELQWTARQCPSANRARRRTSSSTSSDASKTTNSSKFSARISRVIPVSGTFHGLPSGDEVGGNGGAVRKFAIHPDELQNNLCKGRSCHNEEPSITVSKAKAHISGMSRVMGPHLQVNKVSIKQGGQQVAKYASRQRCHDAMMQNGLPGCKKQTPGNSSYKALGKYGEEIPLVDEPQHIASPKLSADERVLALPSSRARDPWSRLQRRRHAATAVDPGPRIKEESMSLYEGLITVKSDLYRIAAEIEKLAGSVLA